MSKFDAFNVTDATYKTVDDHDIGLSILTPKDIKPGKYPVIIRFHGGFLVTGTRLFPQWFPSWPLSLALATPAILISPDYRLLPESVGTDILSDITSLFDYIHSTLPSKLSSLPIPLEADLTRILVTGESAGGYLAIQSALLHANRGITAAISAYGVLDIKSRFFTEKYEKIVIGAPMTGEGVLERHMEAVRQGQIPKVVSEGLPPARTEVMLHIVQHGRYVEVLGEESVCYPMENLKRVQKGGLVPVWLFHGKQDSAVPWEGSVAFVEGVKELHPEAAVKLTLEDGEHGLDSGEGVSAETPWIKEGLAWVKKHWLGSKAHI